MATKKKPFTVERYDEIKKVLKDNKIESYELESYIMMKDIKFFETHATSKYHRCGFIRYD